MPANGPHAAYVAELAAYGVASVFSSTAAHYFSLEHGVKPLRQPDDLDLLVSKDAFLEAFWMLAPNRRRLIPGKLLKLMSADGAHLSLVADEITGWPHASGEGPEIQIMRPQGPVKCEMPDGSVHYYDTSLDEELASYNVRGGSLPYLHPKAGAMLYRMYQRSFPKLDIHNAQVLDAAAGLTPATSRSVQAIMEARGFDQPRIQPSWSELSRVALAAASRADLAVAA